MGEEFWLLKKIKREKRLRREEMRQALLQEVKEKVRSYFQERGIKEVYLFDSIIREGNLYQWSDVDIAVSF